MAACVWTWLMFGGPASAASPALPPRLLQAQADAFAPFEPPPGDDSGAEIRMTWAEAASYCADPRQHHGVSLRLPTVYEVATLWSAYGAQVALPPPAIGRLPIRENREGRALRAELERMAGPRVQVVYELDRPVARVWFSYAGPTDQDLRPRIAPPLADFRVDAPMWTATPTRPDGSWVWVHSEASAERLWNDRASAAEGDRQPLPRYAVMCHQR